MKIFIGVIMSNALLIAIVFIGGVPNRISTYFETNHPRITTVIKILSWAFLIIGLIVGIVIRMMGDV